MSGSFGLFAAECDTGSTEARELEHDALGVIGILEIFLGILQEDCTQDLAVAINKADEVFGSKPVNVKGNFRFVFNCLRDYDFFEWNNKIEQRHVWPLLLFLYQHHTISIDTGGPLDKNGLSSNWHEAMMRKISELTLAERDDYVCRQSIAVLRACGYDMPEEMALDYLLDSDSVPGYRFDVLDCVFNCIAFTLQHRRDDTEAKEAMENLLQEVGAENVVQLTDHLFRIAESAARDELETIVC